MWLGETGEFVFQAAFQLAYKSDKSQVVVSWQLIERPLYRLIVRVRSTQPAYPHGLQACSVLLWLRIS